LPLSFLDKVCEYSFYIIIGWLNIRIWNDEYVF
jgi:hypothetical protein